MTGDSAIAKYEAEAAEGPSDLGGLDQTVTPRAGEMTFVRHGGRGEIVGHRFVGR